MKQSVEPSAVRVPLGAAGIAHDDLQWIFDALAESFARTPADEDSGPPLAQILCDGATRSGKFTVAWLAEADRGVERAAEISAISLASAASGTAKQDAPCALPASVFGDALGNGRALLGNDVETEDQHRKWYKDRAGHGPFSFVAAPFVLNETRVGMFAAYSGGRASLSPDDWTFLDRCVASFQMAWRLRANHRDLVLERRRHGDTMARLNAILEQSLETLSEAMVSRDPYTVGHEKHVARIARRIALEAGFEQDAAHLIYLASLVHDIGKIKVPLELLTKPTKLRPQEFEIIKQHAQGSYDILSKIDWPGPLAEIVWQHHEKLDGTGYPQGLKGAQILKEARILSIADVLESVTARRPYRQGLGSEAAMKILNAGRGSAFEPAYVDIVSRLFETEPNWMAAGT